MIQRGAIIQFGARNQGVKTQFWANCTHLAVLYFAKVCPVDGIAPSLHSSTFHECNFIFTPVALP